MRFPFPVFVGPFASICARSGPQGKQGERRKGRFSAIMRAIVTEEEKS